MDHPPHPLRYYIILDENEHGPFEIKDLERLIKDQVATYSTVLREENSLQRVSLKEVLDAAKSYETNLKKKKILPSILFGGFLLVTALIVLIFFGFYNRITSLESYIESQKSDLKENFTSANEGTKSIFQKEISDLQGKTKSIHQKIDIYNSNLDKLNDSLTKTEEKLGDFISDLAKKTQTALELHKNEQQIFAQEYKHEIQGIIESLAIINKELQKTQGLFSDLAKKNQLTAKDLDNFKKEIDELKVRQEEHLKRLNIIDGKMLNIKTKN